MGLSGEITFMPLYSFAEVLTHFRTLVLSPIAIANSLPPLFTLRTGLLVLVPRSVPFFETTRWLLAYHPLPLCLGMKSHQPLVFLGGDFRPILGEVHPMPSLRHLQLLFPGVNQREQLMAMIMLFDWQPHLVPLFIRSTTGLRDDMMNLTGYTLCGWIVLPEQNDA